MQGKVIGIKLMSYFSDVGLIFEDGRSITVDQGFICDLINHELGTEFTHNVADDREESFECEKCGAIVIAEQSLDRCAGIVVMVGGKEYDTFTGLNWCPVCGRPISHIRNNV